MIGLILENDAAKRIYITTASVQINTPQATCQYWLAKNPRANEPCNVKAWGGLVDRTFNLSSLSSIKAAAEKVYEINTTIPYFTIQADQTIPSILNGLITTELKQSREITKLLARGLLDDVYVNDVTGGLSSIDNSLDEINPSNIFLPDDTELKATTSQGVRSGFYVVTITPKGTQPYKLPLKKALLTDTQLSKLRPLAASIEIHEGFTFSGKMVRLSDHKLYKQFNDILVFARRNNKEEVAKRLIVGALMNARTKEGHASSVSAYLKGQSWVRAFNDAQSMLELGINTTKLNHTGVTYERE